LEGLKSCVSAVNADDMCYACFNSAYPIAEGEKPAGDSKYVFEQRKAK
jgi:amidophosphoribosyltransferase